jgi:hypothetical protein
MLLFCVLFTVWNGADGQEAVLSALSYTPIMHFKRKWAAPNPATHAHT